MLEAVQLYLDGMVKAGGEVICAATDLTVGLAEIGIPGKDAPAA